MAGEDIRISEFNELQFKMIRIHKLQDQINELWINPLSPNFSFGDYNYNLIIAILEDLYSEVHAKCSKEEQDKIKEDFENIEDTIEKNPPYVKGNHPTSKRASLDMPNWKELKRELKRINLYIRTLLDNHGYSPDKSWDDGL